MLAWMLPLRCRRGRMRLPSRRHTGLPSRRSNSSLPSWRQEIPSKRRSGRCTGGSEPRASCWGSAANLEFVSRTPESLARASLVSSEPYMHELIRTNRAGGQEMHEHRREHRRILKIRVENGYDLLDSSLSVSRARHSFIHDHGAPLQAQRCLFSKSCSSCSSHSSCTPLWLFVLAWATGHLLMPHDERPSP